MLFDLEFQQKGKIEYEFSYAKDEKVENVVTKILDTQVLLEGLESNTIYLIKFRPKTNRIDRKEANWSRFFKIRTRNGKIIYPSPQHY